jgi:endonuclease YncB( thermonuclease family)
MATNQDPQGSTHSKQRLAQTPFSGAEAVRKIMENFAGIQSAMSRFGETLYAISASANKVDFEFKNLARIVKMGRSSYSGGGGNQGGGQYSTWQPSGEKGSRGSSGSSGFERESEEEYEARLIAKKKLYDKINPQKVKDESDPGGLKKYVTSLIIKESQFKTHLNRMNAFYKTAMALRYAAKYEIVKFYDQNDNKHKPSKGRKQSRPLPDARSQYEIDADKASQSSASLATAKPTTQAANPTPLPTDPLNPNRRPSTPIKTGSSPSAPLATTTQQEIKKAHTVVLDIETAAPEGVDINHPDYTKVAQIIQAAVVFLDSAGNVLEKVNHFYPLKEGNEYPAKFQASNNNTLGNLEATHRAATKTTGAVSLTELTKLLKDLVTEDTIFAGHNQSATGFDLAMLENSHLHPNSDAESLFKALDPFLSGARSHDTMLMTAEMFHRQGEIENKPSNETELFKKFKEIGERNDPTKVKGPDSPFTLDTLMEAFAPEVEEFVKGLDLMGVDLTNSHDAFSDAVNAGIAHRIMLQKLTQQSKIKLINDTKANAQLAKNVAAEIEKDKKDGTTSDIGSGKGVGKDRNILNIGDVLQVEIVKSIPLFVTFKGAAPGFNPSSTLDEISGVVSSQEAYGNLHPDFNDEETKPGDPPIPVAIKKVPVEQTESTHATELGEMSKDTTVNEESAVEDASPGLSDDSFSIGMAKSKRKKGREEPNILDADMGELFKSFATLAHPIVSKAKIFTGTLPPEKTTAIGAENHEAFGDLTDSAKNLIQNFQRAFNIDISELIDFSAFKVVTDKKDIRGNAGIHHTDNIKDREGKNTISLFQGASDTGSTESASFNTFLHESIHAMFSRLRKSTGLKGIGVVDSIDTSVLSGLPKAVAEQYNAFAEKTKKTFIKTLAIQNFGDDSPDSLSMAEEQFKKMPYFSKPEEQYATLADISHGNATTKEGELSYRQEAVNKNPKAIPKNRVSSDAASPGIDSISQTRRGFIGSVLSGVLGASLVGTKPVEASGQKPWLQRKQEYEKDKSKGFDSAKPYVGELIEVLDGDTIKALVNGVQVNIRTQYNDAPESDQPMGPESKAYLQKLLGPPGSQFLAHPTTENGSFGRESAYNRPLASINNSARKDVVTEMLRAGMTHHAYQDSSPVQDTLSAALVEGSQAEKGVHQYSTRGSSPVNPSDWRRFSPKQKAQHIREREIAKEKEKPKDISPEPLKEDSSISPLVFGLGIGAALGATVLASRAYNHSLAKKRTLLKRKAEWADYADDESVEDASPGLSEDNDLEQDSNPANTEVPNLGLDRGLAMMKKYAKGKLVTPLRDRGPSLLGNFIKAIVNKAKLPLILGTVALLAGSMITQASHAVEVEPPSNKATSSLVSELGDKLTPEPTPELDNAEPPSPAPTPTPEEDVKPAIKTKPIPKEAPKKLIEHRLSLGERENLHKENVKKAHKAWFDKFEHPNSSEGLSSPEYEKYRTLESVIIPEYSTLGVSGNPTNDPDLATSGKSTPEEITAKQAIKIKQHQDYEQRLYEHSVKKSDAWIESGNSKKLELAEDSANVLQEHPLIKSARESVKTAENNLNAKNPEMVKAFDTYKNLPEGTSKDSRDATWKIYYDKYRNAADTTPEGTKLEEARNTLFDLTDFSKINKTTHPELLKTPEGITHNKLIASLEDDSSKASQDNNRLRDIAIPFIAENQAPISGPAGDHSFMGFGDVPEIQDAKDAIAKSEEALEKSYQDKRDRTGATDINKKIDTAKDAWHDIPEVKELTKKIEGFFKAFYQANPERSGEGITFEEVSETEEGQQFKKDYEAKDEHWKDYSEKNIRPLMNENDKAWKADKGPEADAHTQKEVELEAQKEILKVLQTPDPEPIAPVEKPPTVPTPVPEVKAPEVKAPEVKAPEVKAPEVKAPSPKAEVKPQEPAEESSGWLLGLLATGGALAAGGLFGAKKLLGGKKKAPKKEAGFLERVLSLNPFGKKKPKPAKPKTQEIQSIEDTLEEVLSNFDDVDIPEDGPSLIPEQDSVSTSPDSHETNVIELDNLTPVQIKNNKIREAQRLKALELANNKKLAESYIERVHGTVQPEVLNLDASLNTAPISSTFTEPLVAPEATIRPNELPDPFETITGDSVATAEGTNALFSSIGKDIDTSSEPPTYAEVIKSYGFQTIKDHLSGIKPEDGEYTSEQEEQRTALNTEINRRKNFKPGIPGTISKDVNNEQVYTAEDGANYSYSETEGIDTRFGRSSDVDPDISTTPKTPPVDRNPYKDKPAPEAQPEAQPTVTPEPITAAPEKPVVSAAVAKAQKDLDDAKAAEASSASTSIPVSGNPPVVTPPVVATTTTEEQEAAAKKVEEQNKLDKANKEKAEEEKKAEKIKTTPLGKNTAKVVKKFEAKNEKLNADLILAQQTSEAINNQDPGDYEDLENQKAKEYKQSKQNEASIEGKIGKNAEIIELIKKVSLANVELKKIAIQEPDKLRTRRLERASYVNQLAKLGAIDLSTKEKLLNSNKEEYDKVEENHAKTIAASTNVSTKPKSEKEDILKSEKENKELTKFQEAADPITLMEALGETANRLTGAAYGNKQMGWEGGGQSLDYTKSFKTLSGLFYGSQEKDAEGKDVESFAYKGTTVDSKGNKTEQEGTVKASSAEEALAMLNDECGMFVTSLVAADTGLLAWSARLFGAKGFQNKMETEDVGGLENNATAHALNFNQQKVEESDNNGSEIPYLAKIVEILQAIMAKNAALDAAPVTAPEKPKPVKQQPATQTSNQPSAQPSAQPSSQPSSQPATKPKPRKATPSTRPKREVSKDQEEKENQATKDLETAQTEEAKPSTAFLMGSSTDGSTDMENQHNKAVLQAVKDKGIKTAKAKEALLKIILEGTKLEVARVKLLADAAQTEAAFFPNDIGRQKKNEDASQLVIDWEQYESEDQEALDSFTKDPNKTFEEGTLDVEKDAPLVQGHGDPIVKGPTPSIDEAEKAFLDAGSLDPTKEEELEKGRQASLENQKNYPTPTLEKDIRSQQIHVHDEKTLLDQRNGAKPKEHDDAVKELKRLEGELARRQSLDAVKDPVVKEDVVPEPTPIVSESPAIETAPQAEPAPQEDSEEFELTPSKDFSAKEIREYELLMQKWAEKNERAKKKNPNAKPRKPSARLQALMEKVEAQLADKEVASKANEASSASTVNQEVPPDPVKPTTASEEVTPESVKPSTASEEFRSGKNSGSLVNVDEALEMLKKGLKNKIVDKDDLRAKSKSKEIKAFQNRGQLLYRVSDLEDFINNSNTESSSTEPLSSSEQEPADAGTSQATPQTDLAPIVSNEPASAPHVPNTTAGMNTGGMGKDTSANNLEALRAARNAAKKALDAHQVREDKNGTGFILVDTVHDDLYAAWEKADTAYADEHEKVKVPTQPKTFAKGKNPVQRQGTDNVEGRFTSRDGKIGSDPILVGRDESIVTAAGSAANPALIAEMNRTGKPVKSFKGGISKSAGNFLDGVSSSFTKFMSKPMGTAHTDRKPTSFGGKQSSGDPLGAVKIFGEQLKNTRVGFFAKSLLGLGGAATHAMNSLASFTKSAGGDTFNTLTGSIDLLVGAIGIQLTPLILRISMFIQNMATQVQNGTGVFGGMVKAVTGFITSISDGDLKFLMTLGLLAAGITALAPIFGVVSGALGLFATGISIAMGLFASPILLAIGGITALAFAIGGFQGIVNLVCGVLNNYKTILGVVASLFGVLAAVWVIANAPLILLAGAVSIVVLGLMKFADMLTNWKKTPEQKAKDKEDAKKDPGIGDKLKNFKMPDMSSAISKVFGSMPGGADLAKELGIGLPEDPTKPKKPTKEEQAAKDKVDKATPVTVPRQLTKKEEDANHPLQGQKQELEERRAKHQKDKEAQEARTGKPDELRGGIIAKLDSQISGLDSQIVKPTKVVSNVYAERKKEEATPAGKARLAKEDLTEKKARLEGMGGQLAMSMKANRAQPAFSSVEEASKKIQISALGVDPLEAKQQLQAEKALQEQLKAYTELNNSVLGVSKDIQATRTK